MLTRSSVGAATSEKTTPRKHKAEGRSARVIEGSVATALKRGDPVQLSCGAWFDGRRLCRRKTSNGYER
jgi:hypothetical protein